MELYGSIQSISGSMTASVFTGSFKGDGSGLYGISATGVTGLNLSQISTGSVTASVSTDGFNVNSNTSITGTLKVSGTIIAEQIDVTIYSSSVLYQSGSTRFGDTLDDNHNITGSVNITGSISLNGEPIGTGKLNETTFNSYTASNDSRVTALETATGSIYSYTASNDFKVTALEISTGSLNSFTSSINSTIKNKLDSDNVVSGSVQVNITSTTGYSTFSSSIAAINLAEEMRVSSLEASSASLNSFSSSTLSRLTNIETSTGSLNTFSSSAANRLSSLETASSSLNNFTSSIDTTIKNKLNNDGVISGSVQVDITQTTNYSSFSSSLATTDLNQSNKISAIETATSSLNSYTSSNNNRMNVIESTTASLNTFTSSASNRLNTIESTTGSLNTFTSSANVKLNAIESTTSSLNSYTTSNDNRVISIESTTASLNSFTSSASSRLNSIETSTGSLNSFTSSINTTIKNKLNVDGVISGSIQVDVTQTTGYNTFSSSVSSSIGALSSSVATTTNGLSSSVATYNLGQDGRLSSLEGKTGSYATTGSNIFVGNQTITGSVTITENLLVYGSSSITYVTASQLAISTSFISVNVFEPAERFGGLKVYDSGSSAATASLAWDSQRNHWIYQNASGSSYSGGMLIAGPRNSGSLGDESSLTSGKIPKSVGGDHIDNSIMNETAGVIYVTGSVSATGTIYGTNITAIESTTSSLNSYTASNDSTNTTQNNRLSSLETSTSSLNSYTSSTNTRLGVIESTTASLNTFTSSAGSRLTSIESTTSSLNTFTSSTNTRLGLIETNTGSLNSYTSSNNARLGVIETATSSLNSFTSSTNTRLGLIETSTGSLNSFTNSINTTIKNKLNTDGVISGSAQVIAALPSGTVSGSSQVLNGTTIHSGSFFNGISVVSGSAQISFGGITGVPSGLVSGSSQITYSSISGIPSGIVSGSSQITLSSTSGFGTYLNQAVLTSSTPTFAGAVLTNVLRGGFGAAATTGTLNWNDSTNARSGQGQTLLTGVATNGPGPNEYFHPFSFEYSSWDGSGNMTQFAIPYNANQTSMYFRGRYAGTWGSWYTMWNSGNDGSGSGLDADLWDGYHFSDYLNQAVKTTSSPTFAGLTSTGALSVGYSTSSEPFIQGHFYNTNTTAGQQYGGVLVSGINQAHIRFQVGTNSWGGSGAKQWQIRVGNGGGEDNMRIYSWTAGRDITTFKNDGAIIAYDGGNAGGFYLSDTGAGLYRDNTYDIVLTQNNSSSGVLYLSGAGNVIVSIDNNNNETDRKFIVGSNGIKATNELFSVNESGNLYNSGNIGIQSTARGYYYSGANRYGINIGGYGDLFTLSNQSLYLGANIYYDNGWYRGQTATGGAFFECVASTSSFNFVNVGSGTAGAAISPTTLLSINASGHMVRGNAGMGWLSGNYGSAESGTSSHVIYSIGGSYVPSGSSLGNMYGIGYANAGTAGYAMQMTNASGWGLYIASNGTPYAFIGSEGNASVFRSTILPHANNSYNLGSATYAWANIYTNDLHMSNMNKEGGNDVDGTNGDWTIQEGAENLYIINNNNGKKYKIKLEEV